MDLNTILRILVRRWVVVIPTVTLAVLVTMQIWSSVKPTYQSSGSTLLLTSSALGPAPQNGATNPFADNLRTTSAALAHVLQSGPVRESLSSKGLSSDYQVDVDETTPILLVTARASKPATAIDTVDALLDRVGTEMARREDENGIAGSLRLHNEVLERPAGAAALTADRTKALLAMLALSVAAVLSAALIAESIDVAWRQRRARLSAVPMPEVVTTADASMGTGADRAAHDDAVGAASHDTEDGRVASGQVRG